MLFLTLFQEAKVIEWFKDNILNLHAWVKCSRWILEYHLNFFTVFLCLFCIHMLNFNTIDIDFTFCNRQHFHNHTNQCCFTRAGFTYNTKRFTFFKSNIDIFTSLKFATSRKWESFIYIFEFYCVVSQCNDLLPMLAPHLLTVLYIH